MKEQNNVWKLQWDKLSQDASSNYELDRGNSCFNEEIEHIAKEKLLDFIGPQMSDTVFDAGCGTGVNLSRLSPRVKTLIGMDYSEGMIARAGKRITEENITNVRLFVGSVSAIPLENNSVDRIICMSVLQYINDEECEAALKEFSRITKDGATIILHVKNLVSLYIFTLYLAKKIKKIFRKDTKIEYYRSYGWYAKRLSALHATILDYYPANIFLLDFFPKSLSQAIKKVEVKYLRGRFFRKYGADLHIKAQIKKMHS